MSVCVRNFKWSRVKFTLYHKILNKRKMCDVVIRVMAEAL